VRACGLRFRRVRCSQRSDLLRKLSREDREGDNGGGAVAGGHGPAGPLETQALVAFRSVGEDRFAECNRSRGFRGGPRYTTCQNNPA
jgi:hypothetical protein